MGRVPLARRNLFADRRRLFASVIGVGLAVMLILLLDGMWSGLRAQAKLYTERSGGQLYVLQPGGRDLTAGAGSLPLGSTLGSVRRDRDVAWAAPVLTAYVILELHGRKVAAYLVGSVPGERGGAWALASGRSPTADDEIVIDTVLAKRHGIEVDDRLDVMGRMLRVVGLSRSNGFMLSYVFVTHRALEQLAGTPGKTSFVVVGTDNPTGVAERLRSEGLNVLTRDQVATNNLKFMTGIFGSPIRLMVGIGLAAGTMIIALTAYTTIVERRREYGITKAMGATRARLVAIALGQTLTLALLGLAAGLALFVVGRWIIATARPQFSVLLTTGAIGRATIAAVVMALLAAVIPARRLAALEPALAYRSAS
jgi:putative ABC transport system permease protein